MLHSISAIILYMQEFTCSYQAQMQNGSCCLLRFMLVYDEPKVHQDNDCTHQFCGLVDSNREPIDFDAPRVPPCDEIPDNKFIPQQVYSWPGCSRINCCKCSANDTSCKASISLLLPVSMCAQSTCSLLSVLQTPVSFLSETMALQ